MEFSEGDLLPISALQHLLFCERQCALIHVEQLWAENRLTAEGRVVHKRAHEEGRETRCSVRAVRGLHIRSLRIGISGVADIVEFHAPEGQKAKDLSKVDFWKQPETLKGWTVLPVEYKRGKQKKERFDEVQLCAQALCLEEMLKLEIERGSLYYGQERSRTNVTFNTELRTLTLNTCIRLRELLYGGVTPPAILKPVCAKCSLIELCMPAVTEGHISVKDYFAQSVAANIQNLSPNQDKEM